MNKTAMDEFANTILRINPSVWGMGESSAGFVGGGGHAESIVPELRKATLQITQECKKQSPNKLKIAALREQIEGYLETMRVFTIISESTCNKLIDDMREFTKV